MKLTPLDIRHQEFSGALSGYHKREVRDFLEKTAEQLETVLRENLTLTQRITELEQQVSDLRQGEEELRRIVISAEKIAYELKNNAEREAHLVLREAENAKENLLREGIQKSHEIRADIDRARNERAQFFSQYRGMLQGFLAMIDRYDTE